MPYGAVLMLGGACRGAEGNAGPARIGRIVLPVQYQPGTAHIPRWERRAQVLTALQGLRSLAVNRCPRIGDKGLLIVQRLSHLTSLNCYGCVKARPHRAIACLEGICVSAAEQQGMLLICFQKCRLLYAFCLGNTEVAETHRGAPGLKALMQA